MIDFITGVVGFASLTLSLYLLSHHLELQKTTEPVLPSLPRFTRQEGDDD